MGVLLFVPWEQSRRGRWTTVRTVRTVRTVGRRRGTSGHCFPQGKFVILQIMWVLTIFSHSTILLTMCVLTNFPWGKLFAGGEFFRGGRVPQTFFCIHPPFPSMVLGMHVMLKAYDRVASACLGS